MIFPAPRPERAADNEATDRAYLVHIPPRAASARGGGGGSARLVRTLASRPDTIAADGRRVWLIYPPNARGGRSVYWLEASPGFSSAWRFGPLDPLGSAAPIETGGALLGAAASEEGLHVLLAGGEGGGPLLLRLADGWERAGLPEEVVRASADGLGTLTLLAEDGRLVVLASGEGGTTRWVRGPQGWTSRDLPSVVAEPVGASAGVVVGRVGRGFEAVTPAGGMRLPAEAEASAEHASALVLPGPAARLVVVTLRRGEAAGVEPVPEGERYTVTEVSLASGEVLYEGGVTRATPIDASDFRALAAALVAVTGAALLIVLTPAPDPSVFALPEGLALAGPLRRFLATGIDLLLVSIPVSALLGLSPLELFSPTVLLRPDGAWVGIPLVLFCGFVYATVLEMAFGRTVGKFVFRCRVAGMARAADGAAGERRADPLACVIRNGVKWLVPPVAALALLDPGGRHRGDALARAAVVIDAPAG